MMKFLRHPWSTNSSFFGPKQPPPVVDAAEQLPPFTMSGEMSFKKKSRASASIPLMGVPPNGRCASKTFWIRSFVVCTSPIDAVGAPKGTMRPSHGGAAALRAPTSKLLSVAHPWGAPRAQVPLVQSRSDCQPRK
jgi:hypothetical protein